MNDLPLLNSLPKPRISMFHRLRNWFLTGVIVTAPIGITVYLVYVFVTFVDRNVAFLLPAFIEHNKYLPFGLPGLGLILVGVGLTIIGFLTANFLGRTLIRFSEGIVSRMPVIRGIYSALKQVFETVLNQSSNSFRHVALMQYPRPGVWSIALVAGDARGEVERRLGADMIAVYLPTTPNPTSGFLLFVPRRDLVFLDMPVDEAMKYIISCGAVAPVDKRSI